jgi:hypothetical protein
MLRVRLGDYRGVPRSVDFLCRDVHPIIPPPPLTLRKKDLRREHQFRAAERFNKGEMFVSKRRKEGNALRRRRTRCGRRPRGCIPNGSCMRPFVQCPCN